MILHLEILNHIYTIMNLKNNYLVLLLLSGIPELMSCEKSNNFKPEKNVLRSTNLTKSGNEKDEYPTSSYSLNTDLTLYPLPKPKIETRLALKKEAGSSPYYFDGSISTYPKVNLDPDPDPWRK